MGLIVVRLARVFVHTGGPPLELTLTFDDRRDVFEAALADIENHDHAGPLGTGSSNGIGDAPAENLVPNDDLAEVDHHDVAEQVRWLVPVADQRPPVFALNLNLALLN